MRESKSLFHLWRRYKSKELSWFEFQVEVEPIQGEFNSLLRRGRYSGNRKLHGFCRGHLKHKAWLWSFTYREGIEPTNNEAERSLRPTVIYRKLTFGTQSKSG